MNQSDSDQLWFHSEMHTGRSYSIQRKDNNTAIGKTRINIVAQIFH